MTNIRVYNLLTPTAENGRANLAEYSCCLYKASCLSRRVQSLLWAVLFAIVMYMWMMPTTVFAQNALFDAPIGIGSPDNTQSLAVGDVNGDGALDLIVGNGTYNLNPDNSVTLLPQQNVLYLNKNDGSGTFSPPIFFEQADITNRVILGDLNGDGALDLVVGNVGQDFIYLNNGQSANPFGNPLPFGGEDKTHELALADFNGDGALDLAAANFGEPSKVYINKNDGSGTFLVAPIILEGNDHATSVVAGDLNRDGFPDIVIGNGQFERSKIYLNRGDGSGTFFAPILLDDPALLHSNAVSAALGDLNGDGALDLVLGNAEINSSGVITGAAKNAILLNRDDGSGTFFPPILFGEPDTTGWITLGDLDGNGFLDLVVANNLKEGSDKIYFNIGIVAVIEQPFLLVGQDHTSSIELGDLNGDGTPDLIIGNTGEQNLIRLNRGRIIFDNPRNFPVSDFTRSIALGDLNGDNFLDVIVGNNGQSNIVYLNGDLSGFLLSNDPDGTNSIATGDLNGDKALDIVVGNGAFRDNSGAVISNRPNQIYLNKNDGSGTFLPPIFFNESNNTSSLALGDLNRDGALDLIVGNYATFDQNGLPISDQQNLIYINKNDGSGTFASPVPLGPADRTTSVAVGDIDGDGTLDIVVGNSGEQNRIYINQSGGSNLAFHLTTLDIQDSTNAVALGDLNGDGALDLVVGNFGQQNLIYLNKNDGSGSFKPPIPFGNTISTYSITLSDVDGNGWLDLVAGNLGSIELYKNRADGSGTFFEAITLGALESSVINTSLALGDLNNKDGKLDLIVGRSQSDGTPAPNLYFLNSGSLVKNLVNSLPAIGVNRPGSTGDANFYSTPEILESPVISIPFTLFDPEGDTIGRVGAFYSLDGGGKWQPAVPTADTPITNLSSGRWVEYANSSGPQLIPNDGSSSLVSNLSVSDNYTIGALEVWFTISHTNNSDLGVVLVSPSGTAEYLVAGDASGQNFSGTRFSTISIAKIISGTAPYAGVYQPLIPGNFAGQSTHGTWKLVILDTAGGGTGTLIDWGLRTLTPFAPYVFKWDTFASGVFGQSDNVVVRLLAYPQEPAGLATPPGKYRYTNSVAGLYRWPFVSATTFPFRVRGTQVQVVLDGNAGGADPGGALVYRQPIATTDLAQPMPDTGQALHTDSKGFLGGRGHLAIGDGLVALWPPPTNPISFTNQLDLFRTSSRPTESGLDFFRVSQLGIQTLRVTDDHKLILANLDVALEWDARKDTRFLEQLTFDLQRTSQLLYDWSDGQLALGKVRVYHDAKQQPEVDGRQPWLDSHIRIYASNRLRPNATQGGIVKEVLPDPDKPDIVYFPGWVNMGASWSRYGDPGDNLGEDWSRALAHELSHYLFFLDDNYLGLADNGVLSTISALQCPGAMNDPYSDVYSEFHPKDGWQQSECIKTLSHQSTARSDWETIQAFYPLLRAPSVDTPVNPGPSSLPLAVTQIQYVAPNSTSTALDVPIFNIIGTNGEVYQPGRSARAILFHEDRVTDLGKPKLDQVLAYGAHAGDRICVFELAAEHLGCKNITSNDDQLQMYSAPGWQPEVIVSPITSQTLAVSVTVASQVDLRGRLFPVNDPASSVVTLTLVSTTANKAVYRALFNLNAPTLEGYIHIWVNEPDPRREVITDFALGENPAFLRSRGAFLRSRGAFLRSRGAFLRSRGAPATSPDGQVILFLDKLQATTDNEWYFALQAATTIPNQPTWATLVAARQGRTARPSPSPSRQSTTRRW